MENEINILIATRVPPSDRWKLIDSGPDETIYKSLTETLEAYYQQSENKPQVFRLEPLKGELYVITTGEVASPPIKKYNIYGDR
jgi:hypothetical protein